MKTREGKINVDGYQVWYHRVGDSDRIPLLTLHGGPGAGHDYLKSLEALSSTRPVIFFDQLGCGKSDKPDDTSLWRIERFVKEVDTVRQALGLDKIHLLGQSWGGWLGIEYMLSKPKGIVSLTLASTSASIPQFVEEAKRLKSELPPEMYQAMLKYEAVKDYHHPDYEVAVAEFYNRHLCRLDPWPEPLQRSGKNLENNAVYQTMNGPNEFIVIGNLKDWNRIDRLPEITVPTLITVGRYDEITPACAETMHKGIANSEMCIFEHSGHTAHLEEPERYMAVLADFLARVESKQ
jgi:proline-specific peptidase